MDGVEILDRASSIVVDNTRQTKDHTIITSVQTSIYQHQMCYIYVRLQVRLIHYFHLHFFMISQSRFNVYTQSRYSYIYLGCTLNRFHTTIIQSCHTIVWCNILGKQSSIHDASTYIIFHVSFLSQCHIFALPFLCHFMGMTLMMKNSRKILFESIEHHIMSPKI